MKPCCLLFAVCVQVLQARQMISAFSTVQLTLSNSRWEARVFGSVVPEPSEAALGDAHTNALSSQDEEPSKRPFSKSKWKKKRFLMMQDVAKLIENRDSRAPRKAAEMITRMHRLSEVHEDEDLRPNDHAYNLWINAISKCSRNSDAGKEAEYVLEEMKQLGIQPTVVSYTSVMDAYAQSSTRNNKAAQEAERVLFELIQQQETNPNLSISFITCDTVLKAWAKRGDFEGAQRAQDILLRLELLQNEDIRPTAHSYGAVIHAWATCNGGIEAAERAETILENMIQAQNKKGVKAVPPDTVVFNSVIHAWANSKGASAGAKAVALLQKMREVNNPRKGLHTAPDIVTYNTVLAAWSNSNDANAAPQTERVLKEMQEAHKKSPDIAPAPNTVSFNSVLHAWARSSLPGAVERSQAVLDFMIRSKNMEIEPDAISFTSVLNAVAKSRETDKATRTRKLLLTLLEMYEETGRATFKPSPVPYNCVLNACAFPAPGTTADQQRQALQVALSTFSEMSEYTDPDTVSYGNLMKCFNNLMPAGNRRNEMALQLFEKCKTQGLVGELVWNEVRRAVEPKILTNAIHLKASPNNAPLKDLPRQWKYRVHSDKLAAQRKSQSRRKFTREEDERKRAPPQRFRNISEPSYESGKDL